ncbi:uncharacterized protein LOC131183464 [Hevea brasiliensis]|uniref:uncharacterized protein LOC131183464 n=1 Tax=Hevea brasiliensis TaxID=3981 RepID=UPI0025F77D28|nr:uncharacterized protein LOC131183464 [Hevea brasiliensis]
MGELTFFLGLQIKQHNDGIFINQSKYIKDILKKFKMDDLKSIGTPISSTIKLEKDEKGKDVDRKLYRATRVDLSKEKKFSNLIPIKEVFKVDDGRKRSKKKEKKKFGDFRSYPHGTAGTSNAKEASLSGVKISKIEEEEEGHNIEIDEKGKEDSKQVEVEEIEKTDEKRDTAEEKSEEENKFDEEKSNKTSFSYIKSNNSNENGKSGSKNDSSQE